MSKTIVKENFNIIFNEILRQYNSQQFVEDSHDKKLTFVMGFIGIVLSIVFTQTSFIFEIISILIIPSLTLDFITSLSIVISIVLIIIAGIIAFLGYKAREFRVGIDINYMMDLYKKDPEKNFKMIVGKYISDAIYNNMKSVKKKGKFLKTSFILMSIGIFLLLILRIIYIACQVFN